MELDQDTIFKFQLFEQQINQIRQQMDLVEQGLEDLILMRQGLEELKGQKGNEILAPIGRGIFARTNLVSEELLVDIGDKTFVKKSIEDTEKIIDEQIKKLEKAQKELDDSLEGINEELTSTMLKAQNKKCSCENCDCSDEKSCGCC